MQNQNYPWFNEHEIESTAITKIKEAYKEFSDEGKHIRTDELEQGYQHFRERFSPEKLRSLDGELLLDTMFNVSNRDGLLYWLEFKSDETFDTFRYGSIGGGSAFKYIMFKRGSNGEWVSGNPKTPTVMSIEEAVSLARLIRDTLLRGADEIANIKHITEPDKYSKLKDKLSQLLEIKEIDKNLSTFGWVHKYYHMIYPDLIDDFHSVKFQQYGLLKLGIRPVSDNRYELAGQYVRLSEACGIAMSNLTLLIGHMYGSPTNYFRIGISADDNGKQHWDEMRYGGYVSIRWNKLGDLREHSSLKPSDFRSTVTDMFKSYYPNDSRAIGNSTSQIVTFFNEINESDIIIAAQGQKVLGIGRVTGSYEYIQDREFPHTRQVDWYYIGETKLPNPDVGILTTVKQYSYSDIDNLLAIEQLLMSSPNKQQSTAEKPIAVLQPLDELIAEIDSMLMRKKQIILYGPPGTGKTYHAERACLELAARSHYSKAFNSLSEFEKNAVLGTDEQKGIVRTCCFHPSYGYEDFIEGMRPVIVDDTTGFTLENGIFKELCQDAKKAPNKKFFLIIDEINRGDISRIFGELIMLIENNKRGKELLLPLSKELFSVPPNVYIVGTMNTADRSIALLDIALRRRFGFIELMPDYKLFNDSVVFDGLPLGQWLKSLNNRICEYIGRDARNLQIGHAYFLDKGKPITNSGAFKRIIKEDIIPLIEEYCYGDYATLARILGDGLVNTKQQVIRYELFNQSDISELVSALLAPSPDLRSDKEETETIDDITDGDTDDEG